MKTTSTPVSIVKLSNGKNWVRFERALGCNGATMHNSLGEAVSMMASEAAERVAILVARGWKAESARV